MAVLTLQRHSSCHSVQVIQGANRRRARMDAPVTRTPPCRRQTRSCSLARNATWPAGASAIAPRQ
eukprot:39440-Alexandrium_andersonii.AAC.1